MVVIRLARHGSKHRPFYHVTVADRQARRDGAFIERVGFYNPIARGKAERLRIDLERVDHWLGLGAQTSGTVTRLVKEARRAVQLQPEPEVDEAAAESESEAAEEVAAAPADATTEASTSGAESGDVEVPAESAVVEDSTAEASDSSEVSADEATAEASVASEATEPSEDSSEESSAATETSADDEKPAS